MDILNSCVCITSPSTGTPEWVELIGYSNYQAFVDETCERIADEHDVDVDDVEIVILQTNNIPDQMLDSHGRVVNGLFDFLNDLESMMDQDRTEAALAYLENCQFVWNLSDFECTYIGTYASPAAVAEAMANDGQIFNCSESIWRCMDFAKVYQKEVKPITYCLDNRHYFYS